MADKEKRQYGARIGNDYWSDNGVEIELGHSINGSGPRAFGGASGYGRKLVYGDICGKRGRVISTEEGSMCSYCEEESYGR